MASGRVPIMDSIFSGIIMATGADPQHTPPPLLPIAPFGQPLAYPCIQPEAADRRLKTIKRSFSSTQRNRDRTYLFSPG